MRSCLSRSPLPLLSVASLTLGTALSGCGPRPVEVPPDASAPASQAQLLPVEALGPDVQWRQRVTASWEGGERSFGAVLSKADGALQLLGLDPMGRVGFRLELRDGEPIRLEKHPSLQFPFDPRFIVRDVQRIYYPWLPEDTAPPAGVRSGTALGYRIDERYQEQRLARRSFWPLGPAASKGTKEEGAALAAEARVQYDYSDELGDVPARAVYQNVEHGYRLIIVTLDVAEL